MTASVFQTTPISEILKKGTLLLIKYYTPKKGLQLYKAIL